MIKLMTLAVAFSIGLSGALFAQQNAATGMHLDRASWPSQPPEIEISALGALRIAVADLPGTLEWLTDEVGLNPGPVLRGFGGEQSATIMLESGQGIEFVSHMPNYEQLPLEGARGVGLVLNVPNILYTSLSLKDASVPATEILPIHASYDPSQPKMFDLILVRAPEFPLWTFSFAQRDEAGILKARELLSNGEAQSFEAHSNGASALEAIWYASSDLFATQQNFAALGLIPDESRSATGHRVYKLGDTELHLISHQHNKLGEDVAARIAQSGEGIFNVIVSTLNSATASEVHRLPGSAFTIEMR